MAAGATSSRGRPRRAAISSGRTRSFSACMVACTMLIGFDEPRLLESTSWMPAHSGPARTGPPGVTPVPGPAGDDPVTRAGRLEAHAAGRRLTLHGVRDGAGDPGHPVEVLLGLLDALGDRRGHLLGLAVADTDGAVTVADDDQRGEAEAPAALDDLGHAVDGDHALDEVALLGGCATGAPPAVTTVAAVVAAAGAAAASLWSWHQTSLSICL